MTTKAITLAEITHTQLLKFQVPESLPVTWENVKSQMFPSLLLA